jgi:hypothetical protein
MMHLAVYDAVNAVFHTHTPYWIDVQAVPGASAEAAAAAESDLARRQTLIQRLAKMTVAQRVQFAMKGGSEARRTLIRDNNKVVQRAVLQSPRLTDQEVEAFAAMSSLTDEILRNIANNRNFRKNYTVVRNLINNPKTPIDVSLHMLPILNAIDLKRLTTNKNVPETLRTTATKLQRTRTESSPSRPALWPGAATRGRPPPTKPPGWPSWPSGSSSSRSPTPARRSPRAR